MEKPMAIKDDAAFQELKPYLRMTVAPNGVTIGDLNFVVAQTQWSTAIQSIATANTIPADVNLDLFQAAQGDIGQGFSTALTRSQTSWLDSQGRLPANQVFIATSCGFQLFKRVPVAGSDPAKTTVNVEEVLLPKLSAVNAIGRNLSWEVTIGDGITRNYGALIDFPGYGGQYGVVNPSVPPVQAADPNAIGFSQGAMLGDPDDRGRKLRIPLVFPPNISVRIKVRGGNKFAVDDVTQSDKDTLGITEVLAVRQYLHGYLCTMPVG
jgi:hypothetical protein